MRHVTETETETKTGNGNALVIKSGIMEFAAVNKPERSVAGQTRPGQARPVQTELPLHPGSLADRQEDRRSLAAAKSQSVFATCSSPRAT